MKKLFKEKFVHIATIIGTILLVVFVVYGLRTNIFTDHDALSNFLARVGIWGPLIFIVIQILQVIIPIIPGNVSCAVGVLVFGPVYGFIYNYFSIILGSVIVFFLSRRYGMGIIRRLFSEKTIDKYISWLDENKRFEKLFALAIFLPVAPDDFLCYLAGVTKMTFKKYLLILILLKPFTILSYSFLLKYIADILLKLYM